MPVPTKSKPAQREALGVLRSKYPDDFELILQQLVKDFPHSTRSRLHTQGLGRLKAAHKDEYRALFEEFKQAKVSLKKKAPKTYKGLRGEMDEMDARILYDRGMSLAEMAAYDHCTQAAAFRALLPMLKRIHKQGGNINEIIEERLCMDTRKFYQMFGEPGAKKQYRIKLNEDLVRQIKQAYAAGESAKAIGKRMGLTRGHVRNVVTGRSWAQVAA